MISVLWIHKLPLIIDTCLWGKHNSVRYIKFSFYRRFVCCWVLRYFLISTVISVASDIEREKSYKCCSEALISAWGSFTCRKSTTRDPRLYFPFEGSHTEDFYALKKSSTPDGIEPANLGSRGEYDNHWTTRVDHSSLCHNMSVDYYRYSAIRFYFQLLVSSDVRSEKSTVIVRISDFEFFFINFDYA